MAKDSVRIFEVGPRDGLQNEGTLVSLKDKVWFAQALVRAGVQDLELGAFVRPDRVPQMADTEQVYQRIRTGKLEMGKSRAWCLVPNLIGLERALASGAERIALFTAATDSFNKKNIGMTVSESLAEMKKIVTKFRQIGSESGNSKFEVRGYVSTVFGCPFEGKVAPRQALRVVEQVAKLGVEQISIGDTIGVATPKGVEEIVKPAMKSLGAKMTAVHFHDTRGTALANTLKAMDLGVRIVDSSAGGLGGCPFAPGASGNLATEDLVYMLNGMGVHTGIDLDELCRVSLKMWQKMSVGGANRVIASRSLQAFRTNRTLVFGESRLSKTKGK